jgi:hypothetical protein
MALLIVVGGALIAAGILSELNNLLWMGIALSAFAYVFFDDPRVQKKHLKKCFFPFFFFFIHSIFVFLGDNLHANYSTLFYSRG